MMTESLLALGGNLGNTRQIFSDAIELFKQLGLKVLRSSQTFSTSPVGCESGETFCNAAVMIACDRRPDELLRILHSVESTFNRRREIHWGPRTLDLDLILFGGEVVDSPHLVIPHPAMWYRRFVLAPSVEIAPHLIHPILFQSIAELYELLTARPVRMRLINQSDIEDFRIALEAAHRATPQIQWLTNDDKVTDPQEFAEVIIRNAAERDPQRSQPANEGSRTIVLYVESAEDAGSQLEHLGTAILG
jgi:2-amino-4-hydroxy-6-hydroxymethyldihydropteridine diphosphokinase